MYFLTSLVQNQQFISDVSDRVFIDKDLGSETFDPQGLPTGASAGRSEGPECPTSGTQVLCP